MYNDMLWDIRFDQGEAKYRLMTLTSCKVIKSVNNLADTATIIIPEKNLNKLSDFQEKIEVGAKVSIKLGYNKKEDLKPEFKGFVTNIVNNGSAIEIQCEDDLYIFRKEVTKKQFKDTQISDIANYLISEILLNPDVKDDKEYDKYTLKCDYDIAYEKFVINEEEAFDVLKRIQSETKADIYFNSEKKELHIHSPYIYKGGDVKYSFHQNIEKSNLEYKQAKHKKLEVVVESKDLKGKSHKKTLGEKGGEKLTVNAGTIKPEDAEKIADAALRKGNADRYEGSFTAWLVPFVQPSDTVKIIDEDYEDRNKDYYVAGVTTSFSDQGGKREVQLSIQLGVTETNG